MDKIHRVREDGQDEIRTGLGWRAVVPVNGSAATDHIPIIDISSMYDADINQRRLLAKEICNAAITSGFFYCRNHNLPADDILNVFSDAKRFFHELTIDEKMELNTSKHEHYWGYYPVQTDDPYPGSGGKNLNEAMNFGYEPSVDPDARMGAAGHNIWPSEAKLPGFKANTQRYLTSVLVLGRALLQLFALGLDLDEHHFDHLASEPYAILKMAYYTGSGLAGATPSGIRPHTDFELLTILLQDDVPSLEVLGSSGSWIPAPPISGTFIVNIGDSLSMLTNGLFVSTMHRVVNRTGRDRYSVPFFLGGRLEPENPKGMWWIGVDILAANREAKLQAIPRFINEKNPQRFQVVSSGEYIRRNLQLSYPKPGVEFETESIEIKV